MKFSLVLGSGHARVIQNFGHEHMVFIRYLHERGVPDDEIIQRAWDTFASTFDFFPESIEKQRMQDLSGKVAVYTSRWTDIEARKFLLST